MLPALVATSALNTMLPVALFVCSNTLPPALMPIDPPSADASISPSLMVRSPVIAINTTAPELIKSDCEASVSAKIWPLFCTRLTVRSPVWFTWILLRSVTKMPPTPSATLSSWTSVSIGLSPVPKLKLLATRSLLA